MNPLNDSWDVVRVICFTMLFVSFMVLTYKGVFSLVVSPLGLDWARLLNLAWIIVTMYGLGEIMFQDAPGGFRLVLIFLISLLNLYVAFFKFSIKHETEDEK